MNNNGTGYLSILLIVLIIWIWNLKSDIKELEENRDFYKDAAYYLNDQILEAKQYIGGSCDEVNSALDNLQN